MRTVIREPTQGRDPRSESESQTSSRSADANLAPTDRESSKAQPSGEELWRALEATAQELKALEEKRVLTLSGLKEPAADEWRFERSVESPPPRWRLHLLLFIATFLTTYLIGGLVYCASLMTILTAHELGHYLQARRYDVPASPPYFIPMPLPPFGTLGAVIAMAPQRAHARALFDLAITGPLAGLVPTLLFSIWGLRLSDVVKITEELEQSTMTLGEPVIFKLLSYLAVGPIEEGHTLMLHPMAYAGWVGIFITALNLIPIGQSDGGHILYTLMPKHAHKVSLAVFAIASATVVIAGLWNYLFLVILLFLVLLIFGFRHPPMVEADARLDRWRTALGWLTLTFLLVGLSARPIQLTGV